MEPTFHPVTADRWDDLIRFFGPQGAYSHCWCTFFRQTGREFDNGCRNAGAGNRAMLESLTRRGQTPGLLAYVDDRPVGWVSVGPREEFPRVLRSPVLRPDHGAGAAGEHGVWSVVCFWLPRENRRRGIARALLGAAVEYARERGARVVEGYPVDTRGGRTHAASIYTGTLRMFADAGFVETRRRSANRPVVRYELR